eukprot:307526-Prymnesium_polylepis.1
MDGVPSKFEPVVLERQESYFLRAAVEQATSQERAVIEAAPLAGRATKHAVAWNSARRSWERVRDAAMGAADDAPQDRIADAAQEALRLQRLEAPVAGAPGGHAGRCPACTWSAASHLSLIHISEPTRRS